MLLEEAIEELEYNIIGWEREILNEDDEEEIEMIDNEIDNAQIEIDDYNLELKELKDE